MASAASLNVCEWMAYLDADGEPITSEGYWLECDYEVQGMVVGMKLTFTWYEARDRTRLVVTDENDQVNQIMSALIIIQGSLKRLQAQ